MLKRKQFLLATALCAAAPAIAQQAEPVPPIQLNQLGFDTAAPKRAILPSPATAPLEWQLLDKRGAVVLRGKTSVFGPDAASGRSVHIIDFGAFKKPGKGYRLRSAELLSRPFDIGPGTRGRLAYDALEFFYHARAGVPIEAHLVGAEWARPAGHVGETATCVSGKDFRGTVWEGCPNPVDVHGGWYDAGDQGKYVVNGGIALWTLLNAYERAALHGTAGRFADGKLKIPEAGNHASDLLDEARYEMEWMLRMQVPTGTHMKLPVGTPPPFVPPATGTPPGPPPPLALPFADLDVGGMAYHKVGDRNWTKLPTPPAEDKEDRVLFPPSTPATLNLAATAAQCARLWRGIDDDFAARCLTAAERAWAAAKRNPEVFALAAFGGSGGYGDRDGSDEFYWAAVELYATTGKAEYLDFIHASPHWTAPVEEPSWGKVATLGTLTLAIANKGLEERDREHVTLSILNAADRFVADTARTGYHVPYNPPGYPWGSTSSLLNRAIILAYAADYTGAARFREGVTDAMDYLLGRNPIDQSFVSGYGARPLRNPHHRFWAHSLDPKLPGPPPGVLSGGPNSTVMGDPVGQGLRGKCAPMTCYADDIQAFTMNEIAINWNAPLFWVASWMDE
jgi:endoglucanase